MSERLNSQKRAGRQPLPADEKRDCRIEIRVTSAERSHLDSLCETGNISMTTLLLGGVFDSLPNLPQFQQLPTDVVQQLDKLQQVASRLLIYTHRLDQTTNLQQQVQNLVYALGNLTNQIRQQVELTALPQQLLEQLTRLQQLLRERADDQTESQLLAQLVQEILKRYKPAIHHDR